MRVMNKMKKLACLVAAITLTLGITTGVLADTVSADSTVTYDGKSLTSNNTDMSKTLSNMMPGDTAEIVVDLKNAGSKDAYYYMSASVIKSFEEAQSTTPGGAAYNVSLRYENPDGTTTYLYGNSTNSFLVGDAGNEAAVGLAQLNANDMIYLGTLGKNQSGKVVMEIKLDGNTTSNAYMSSLANLRMAFGAENAPEDIYITDYIPGKVIKVRGKDIVITEETVPLAPKTGDAVLPLVLSLVAFAVGAGLFVWAFMAMKKQNGKEVS